MAQASTTPRRTKLIDEWKIICSSPDKLPSHLGTLIRVLRKGRGQVQKEK